MWRICFCLHQHLTHRPFASTVLYAITLIMSQNMINDFQHATLQHSTDTTSNKFHFIHFAILIIFLNIHSPNINQICLLCRCENLLYAYITLIFDVSLNFLRCAVKTRISTEFQKRKNIMNYLYIL